MSSPEISVVIPTYRRPIRLRWLLNALEEQTVDRGRFEVLVAYQGDDAESEELLSSHPLAASGALRRVACPPSGPAPKRNAAWRNARAPLVVFTDDDCRPPEDWLENALASARRHAGAVIQGRTMPDPAEHLVWEASPWALSQRIEPPHPSGQTCNIVYPLELLERVGGFDESFGSLPVGEDTDLLQRAVKSGAEYVGASEVLTYHAVEPVTLLARIRWIRRWQELPALFSRHPELRGYVPFGRFWKWTHPTFLLGAAGIGLAVTRGRPWALLALPWVQATWPFHGRHLRGVVRSLLELPGRAAIDATEIAVLARGSLRHRSLFL